MALAVAATLAIGLAAFIAVLASGATGGGDGASTDSAAEPPAATRGPSTTRARPATPTPEETAAADLGGTFVGSFRTTTCQGFEEMVVDGVPYDCPGPNDMSLDCSPGDCQVLVYGYWVPIQFDGHRWTGSTQAVSPYPRSAACGGDMYEIVLSVQLTVTQAIEDRRASSGWRAAELRGNVTEESVGDCDPIFASAEFFDFRPG